MYSKDNKEGTYMTRSFLGDYLGRNRANQVMSAAEPTLAGNVLNKQGPR